MNAKYQLNPTTPFNKIGHIKATVEIIMQFSFNTHIYPIYCNGLLLRIKLLLIFSIFWLSIGSSFADQKELANNTSKNDGYVNFKNLCAYKVYFHVDFQPPNANAGVSNFPLLEDETYRLYFGSATAYVCYTRNENGIRKCQEGSTSLKAGQLFEACGDDNAGDE